MTERPIIFSGPMVRAIFAGRKTVTRRVVKPQPGDMTSQALHLSDGVRFATEQRWRLFPYGQPGDRLWLREAWQYADWTEDGEPFIRYRADDAVLLRSGDEKSSDAWATLSDPSNYEIDGKAADRRWRSPIHMPRWASRITLEVVDVRVERLQEISKADAESEGVFALGDEPLRGDALAGVPDR